jgi:hypothetical protein
MQCEWPLCGLRSLIKYRIQQVDRDGQDSDYNTDSDEQCDSDKVRAMKCKASIYDDSEWDERHAFWMYMAHLEQKKNYVEQGP